MKVRKRPERKDYIPQPYPLYAAFANALFDDHDAHIGMVIGWVRYPAHDHTDPVIVPLGGNSPLDELWAPGDCFWDYLGADMGLFPSTLEARNALPAMTKKLRREVAERRREQAKEKQAREREP